MIDSADVREFPKLDDYDVPLEIPDDFDTSNWPEMLTLAETYDLTAKRLWLANRSEHKAYVDCLDALIGHCYVKPETARHRTKTFLRRHYHHLVCGHFGYDVECKRVVFCARRS